MYISSIKDTSVTTFLAILQSIITKLNLTIKIVKDIELNKQLLIYSINTLIMLFNFNYFNVII